MEEAGMRVRHGQHTLALVLSLLLASSLPAASAPDERFIGQVLVVLNWANYLAPEVVSAFESTYRVTVKQVYFESEEARDRLLAETSGEGFDVIVLDGSTLPYYAKRGWVRPLDPAKIPNTAHVDPGICSTYEGLRTYGMPYFWGSIGIAYRTDLVPDGIRSWHDLFEPKPALHGKIAMLNDSAELVGAALKGLGHSLNSADPVELAAASRLLLAQRPHVRTYSLIQTSADSPLVTGQISAAMIYNGDAALLQEHHPAIAFVHPVEGVPLWCDYLAVTSSSQRPELAHAFIDFANEPRQAAHNAAFVSYATPNRAAEARLPPEFLEDETLYPGAEVLAKSEFFGKLPPRALRLRMDILTQLVSTTP
jgi:spermidine/putrescine transport system substrate-binding protein